MPTCPIIAGPVTYIIVQTFCGLKEFEMMVMELYDGHGVMTKTPTICNRQMIFINKKYFVSTPTRQTAEENEQKFAKQVD